MLLQHVIQKFDLDSSDVEEPSTEDIQEVYQIMYDNWVKVCKTNKALKEKVTELTKEKEVLKKTTINYEFLSSDRERKIQQISSELINTQKNLKMLNSGTTKFDQILTMGQSIKQGLGYNETTNTAATTPKIVFVKACVANDVIITSKTVSATTTAKK